MLQDIEAILFDMNSTLRRRETHEPTRRAALEQMLVLLNKKAVSEVFWDELEQRYRDYTRWAQENLVQVSEQEIWTGWLLPDYPSEQIAPVAAELMLAWSQRKGRTVPMPGAKATLQELVQRGYRLGVISNTASSLDVPNSLNAYGWKDYFQVVILASTLKSRKPAPDLFIEAARQLKVTPGNCAYIGNRPSRDVVGCKRAGFRLGIIIETPGGPGEDLANSNFEPDAVIHSLGELLEYFPVRNF